MAQHLVHTRKKTTKKHTRNNKTAMAMPGMAGVDNVFMYSELKSVTERYSGSDKLVTSFLGKPVNDS